MGKSLNYIKFILGILLLFLIKYYSHDLSIYSFGVFYLIEFVFFFISGFIISYSTDYSKDFESEKIKKSLFISLYFSIVAILLTFFKIISPVWLANYLIFFLMVTLPNIRDYFFYYKNDKKTINCFLITILFFFFYKLIFNVINSNYDNLNMVNSIAFSIIPIFIRLVYSITYYFFINGNVEFDDCEYPIFSQFRVGRTKQFDIFAPEIETDKKLIFTISVKNNKFYLKPNTVLKIDSKTINEKTEIDDNETIKISNNYFTVTKGRGNFIKKIFILFFYIFLLNINIFTNNKSDLVFTDFSKYPEIKLFTPYFGENYIEENIFILEDDNPVSKKISTSKEFDIELYLILDVTGNMVDQYKKIINHSDRLFDLINSANRKISISIITFADDKSDIKNLGFADNSKKFKSLINDIRTIQGNDFFENPLDAIFSINPNSTNNDSLKVFVLFTDAPPHQRGSRGKDGVLDFTEKTIEDAVKYINKNNILFYTASYKRYDEYKSFYKNANETFYEIENIDDLGNSLFSMVYEISKMIKIEYKSLRSLRNLRNNISVFYGDDAKIHKRDNKINKIRERMFLRSLFDNY